MSIPVEPNKDTSTKPSKCRSCGKPLRWAVTAKGIAQPIDFLPDPKGNLVIETTQVVKDGHIEITDRVRVADPLFDRGVDLYMPHHAVCPAAAEWRKKR